MPAEQALLGDEHGVVGGCVQHHLDDALNLPARTRSSADSEAKPAGDRRPHLVGVDRLPLNGPGLDEVLGSGLEAGLRPQLEPEPLDAPEKPPLTVAHLAVVARVSLRLEFPLPQALTRELPPIAAGLARTSDSGIAREQRLRGLRARMTRAKPPANDRLEPEEGVLDSTLPMVARLPLPSAPADFTDSRNCSITLGDTWLSLSRLGRVLGWWDDNSCTSSFSGLVDRYRVVGAVGREARDLLVH